MSKAKKAKKIWLSVLIITAVSGVASILGIVIFASNSLYVLMAICIALVVHAFYGTTFYAMAFANAGHDLRIVSAVENYGLLSTNELARAASLSINETKNSMKRCINKGYLKGYSYTDEGLAVIEDKRPKKPEPERFCQYCGRKLSKVDEICPGCGAPVNL